MPKTVHHLDFVTTLPPPGNLAGISVSVEAVIAVDYGGEYEISDVKVFMGGQLEIKPNTLQMQSIIKEIHEQFEPDEPGADWRNEWE